MIEFKNCPRCRGDLYRAQDMYGRYISCFQCGYMRDLPAEQVMAKPVFKVKAVEKRKAA